MVGIETEVPKKNLKLAKQWFKESVNSKVTFLEHDDYYRASFEKYGNSYADISIKELSEETHVIYIDGVLHLENKQKIKIRTNVDESEFKIQIEVEINNKLPEK